MRKFILGMLMVGSLAPAFAVTQQELDQRMMKLTAKFDVMQSKSDKRVPADLLAKAKGIILLDRTKAGFIFAYQGGSGVVMVKDAAGNWSPPAFLSANEASLGFQVGGEQNFYVILLMTTNATAALGESTIDFGGEARGTGGNKSKGREAAFNSREQSVIVYSDRTGVFGAAAIKGGAIGSDTDANVIYYKQAVSMSDILFHNKVTATQTATDLATKISDHAKKKP
jgi:lipid-binding SYLF domain-containing protein